MENNIIHHSTGTIIMNGGNPLEGCPKSFEEANAWADNANQDKDEHSYAMWKFDCGFKLDYDGPIIRVSSRFYPPKTHYGDTWDGTVSIMIGEKTVKEKKFNCKTLEKLRAEVEDYIHQTQSKIESIFSDMG